MPCSDGMGPTEYYAEGKQDAIHNSKVAEMLCAVCRGYLPKEARCEIPGLEEWWQEHQARDQEKKRREDAVRKNRNVKLEALKKLTSEELQALGLNFNRKEKRHGKRSK